MEKMGKNLVGLIEKISKQRQQPRNKSEPTVVGTNKKQPPYICQFKSKAQMDMWLFCMQQKITLDAWAESFKKTNFKEPPMSIFEMPLSRQLGNDGNIPIGIFNNINTGIDKREIKKKCRICWGYGLAYIIRGPLLFESIPGKLIATKCWCQR